MSSLHEAHPGQIPTDSGDARAASAQIEAWLAGRSGMAGDHGAPFEAMRQSLQTICQMPKIREDESARAILNEMAAYASAGLMEEIVTSLDRLERRLRRRGRESAKGRTVTRRRARTLLRL